VNSRRLLRTGIALAAGALVGWGALELALRLTPLPEELSANRTPSVEFLDRNGKSLRALLVDEQRLERHCALSEVSPWVIAATLGAEDKRFHRHRGIDFPATVRAVRDALLSGKIHSGASTISQQLVKLSLRDRKRTPAAKLREIWLAAALERRWPKDRILETYLNRLDYGNLQIGIASASWFYFRKPPRDLSPAEAALLAGLPKAPSRLNPHENLPGAISRQQWILHRMAANGMLRPSALARALEEPLRLADPALSFAAPHFVGLLLQRRGLLPETGGGVVTTLDLALNRQVESILKDQLALMADKNATSGAVVVIDNPTGEVLALVGSADYFEPGSGAVNGAWMPRSPGSAIKPFAYALAIENGANPCTVVPDVPTEFETPTGLYRPNNYNHRFYGPVSLRFALGNSLNVAAIRVEQLGGGPEALHRLMRRLGVTSFGHPAEHYGLGLVLGNGEVRLLELANAYATFARGGVHRPYRLVRSPDEIPAGERVLDEGTAWLIADMLADNAARSSSFGWNSPLRFDFPVACKTGTSSDYRDNWTVGFTPEFTVAVWVGNPDGSPMREITGVTGAAPVMHEVMELLHRTRGTTWFARPETIADYWVQPLSGKRVAAGTKGAIRTACRWEPRWEPPSDRDSRGRLILGPEYAAWLAGPQNSLGDLVTCAPVADALRIVQPRPGAVYFLDPDLPAESQRIALKAESTGAVSWSSSSLDCSAGVAHLREGTHEIIAKDAISGETATTRIEVRGL